MQDGPGRAGVGAVGARALVLDDALVAVRAGEVDVEAPARGVVGRERHREQALLAARGRPGGDVQERRESLRPLRTTMIRPPCSTTNWTLRSPRGAVTNTGVSKSPILRSWPRGRWRRRRRRRRAPRSPLRWRSASARGSALVAGAATAEHERAGRGPGDQRAALHAGCRPARVTDDARDGGTWRPHDAADGAEQMALPGHARRRDEAREQRRRRTRRSPPARR